MSGANDCVSEDAHIWSSEIGSEINKPASIGKLLAVFLRVTLMQIGRTADARDTEASSGDLLLRLPDARGVEFRTRRKIHRSLQSTQFHGRKTALLGEVKNLEPVPARAAQRRKADGQPVACGAESGRQRRHGQNQAF